MGGCCCGGVKNECCPCSQPVLVKSMKLALMCQDDMLIEFSSLYDLEVAAARTSRVLDGDSIRGDSRQRLFKWSAMA